MIKTYNECIKEYKSDYQLKKAIKDNRIFQIEKGIYSDSENILEEEVIMAKYPNSVFTGESAYYYHGLTDSIPDYYVLASKRNSTRTKEDSIHQNFVSEDRFEYGITSVSNNGSEIRVYNLERMLVELVRSKSKLPFDYYKEIIGNYRNRIYEMDFSKVEEYANKYKNVKEILKTIQLEVL